MTMDTEKTPVLFRMVKPNREFDETDEWLIALFPTYPGTNDRHTCDSYMHVGQHGSADLRGIMHNSRAAKPSEYADLAKELRAIGYNLDIKKRTSVSMDRERHAALR